MYRKKVGLKGFLGFGPSFAQSVKNSEKNLVARSPGDENCAPCGHDFGQPFFFSHSFLSRHTQRTK